MPTLTSRIPLWIPVLLAAISLQAQDLLVKKSLTVGGNPVSSTEILIKGTREHIVNTSPAGTTITLKQCDLKRTITLNEDTQTYFVGKDPEDAAVTGTAPADPGPAITETSVVTDTGERKLMFGIPARHLKTAVSVKSSQNACGPVSQKYEVDGWYMDMPKEQMGCQAYLPPVQQAAGCNDRVIRQRSGAGKLGYPLKEAITLHNEDGTTASMHVQVTNISKKALEPEVFDIPDGYREVKTLAELNPEPAKGQQASSLQPAALHEALSTAGMAVASTQMVPAKTAGKIRIGVAPPEAQLGQGNNSGADYSSPIRNAEISLMSGPAVEITPLDSHVAMQLQAEAKQKQCDYIMYSSVTVKHPEATGFGKFAKYGSLAASMTPMGAMAHGMAGAMAAQAASAAASQMAQKQAMNQLAGFNGQVKSKDDVTVQYQLVAAGQSAPVLQNSLQGKAKSDGEDVLTPLLQQAATNVVTQVSKK